MKSAPRGKRTFPEVEVTNVSRRGFSLVFGGRELFLSFKVFPWFRDASIGQLTNVVLYASGDLHWPELDADLCVESIEHPERFPLRSSNPAPGLGVRCPDSTKHFTNMAKRLPIAQQRSSATVTGSANAAKASKSTRPARGQTAAPHTPRS